MIRRGLNPGHMTIWCPAQYAKWKRKHGLVVAMRQPYDNFSEFCLFFYNKKPPPR